MVTTAVCDSSSGRFVDNAEDVEIGDSRRWELLK
jgi:hypothetical protein